MTVLRLAAQAPRLEGGAPEAQVARDLVRRGLIVAPLFLAIGAIGWGANGAVSALLGLAVVCLNFLFAAWLITTGAKISLAFLMGAVMFGYVLRLALVIGVYFAVRNQPWFERVPFAIALLVAHCGLLVWEIRYVSASLAYPGLKPSPRSTRTPS